MLMGFKFTCDICESEVGSPKHITGLKSGLLTVCEDCKNHLRKYASHLRKKAKSGK